MNGIRRILEHRTLLFISREERAGFSISDLLKGTHCTK